MSYSPAITAAYAIGPNNSGGVADDKDGAGSTFEFTRRKRWPQLLLQELVGSALFCLRPILTSGSWSWKIIYATPSTSEMLGRKPADLEGTDFIDLIFTPDHLHVTTLFTSLLSPITTPSSTTTPSTDPSPTLPAPLTSNLGKSQTVYARINVANGTPGSSGSGIGANGEAPIIWELRAHATGLEDVTNVLSPGGQGTVVPRNNEHARGRAVWVMGRKVDSILEGDQQSLETFLELKLENERLREELKELQVDLYDNGLGGFETNPYPPSDSDAESDEISTSSSDTSSRALKKDAITSSGRKPKPVRESEISVDPSSVGNSASTGAVAGGDISGGGEKEKKRKRASLAVPVAMGASTTAAAVTERMYVCVTCGRTDSPEWRKGPLGPKTLCNACGLRWAKRNSANAGKKENKKDKK